MTYDAFKDKYIKLLKKMLSYTPDQAGSYIYASKISDLLESVPAEWEDRVDTELIYGEITP